MKTALKLWIVLPLAVVTVWLTASRVQSSSSARFEVSKTLDIPSSHVSLALAWSPDSQRIAVAYEYCTHLSTYDLSGATTSTIVRSGGGINACESLSFLAGSTEVLSAVDATRSQLNGLEAWSVPSTKPAALFEGPNDAADPRGNLCWSSLVTRKQDYIFAAFQQDDRNLGVYKSTSGAPASFMTVEGRVSAMSELGPEGGLVAGTTGGLVDLIDYRRRVVEKSLRVIEPNEIGAAWVMPIAGSYDGSQIAFGTKVILINCPPCGTSAAKQWERSLENLKIIDVKTGGIRTLATAAVGAFRDIKWDPLGRFIAVVDVYGHVYLESVQSSPQSEVPVHTDSAVNALAISADGKKIALTSDRGLSLYDVLTHTSESK